MANPNYVECAACGSINDIHEHHLVPRAYGGINLPTVFLCVDCHVKVHNLQYPTNYKELQAVGIARAKADGKYKGQPPHARAKAPQVIELAAAGRTRANIAITLEISERSVYRILAEHQ